MTFKDLPPDWPTRPVTDSDITADLLDLIVRDADRVGGAMCLLLCGKDGRLVQPLVVSELPAQPDPAERRHLFEFLRPLVGPAGFLGGVLVAIARERDPFVTDADRAWHESAIQGCRAAGLQLLGVWLVTRQAIQRLPDGADLDRDLDEASA